MEGVVSISVGTLDDLSAVTPQAVIFARSKAHWDMVESALQTFET
jgi:hypothetical protein